MLSIITPVKNGAQYIEKLIISVSKLNIHFEHIIIEGGSVDGTLDILYRYPHLKVIKQKEAAGMYAAIHEGFEYAIGEFVTWINADDWVLADGYERLYALISENEYDLVYGDGRYYYLDEDKYVDFRSKPCGKFLLQSGVFPCLQPSTIYRKYIVDKIGGLNFEKFKIAGDIDFFIRYSQSSTKPFGRIQEPCVVFLKYGESLGDRNHEIYLSEKKKIADPKYGHFGTMFAKIIYKLSG